MDGATMVFGVPTMYRRLGEAAEQAPAWPRRWGEHGCWSRARPRYRPPSTNGCAGSQAAAWSSATA